MNMNLRNLFARWRSRPPAQRALPAGSPVEPPQAAVHALTAQALADYIDGQEHAQVFAQLLQRLLDLSASSYGFIGQVAHHAGGQTALQMLADSALSTAEHASHTGAGGVLDDLIEQVLCSAQPLRNNALPAAARRPDPACAHPPLSCFIGLPLQHQGQLLGMLGLANRPGGYDPELETLLAPLLVTLGQLLAALQRDTQRQQAQREAQHLQEALRTLNDIAALANRQPQEQLRQALQLASGFYQLPVAVISRVRLDDFEVLCHLAPEHNLADGEHLPLEQTYSHLALQSDDVLAIAHMGNSVHAGHPCYQRFGYESYIGTLIRLNGQRYGALGLASREPRAQGFDLAEREFIRLLARWIGATLEHQQQLQQRHELLNRLQHMTNQTPGMVYQFQIEADGRRHFPFASAGIRDIYGLEPEQVLHNSQIIQQLIHPDDLPRINASIERSGRRLSPWHEEYRVLHPLRGLIWVEGRATPQAQNDGSLIWHGVISDISQRKRIEETLREERQRLASIIASTDLGTWEWNVQSGAMVFNARWAEMLGYRLEELAPLDVNTWERLSHPADLEHCRALLNQHFSGAQAYYNSILRMRHKAGHWVWVNTRGSLVKRTEDGLPLLMYGTHTDISASHQQDEQARRTRAFLQAVVDSSTEVAMIATDRQGLITLFNPGAERLLGYSAAAMVGLQTPALFHLPSEIQARAEALGQALGRPLSGIEVFTEKTHPQEPATHVWTYVQQNGQQRQVNLSVTAIRDEQEHITGFLGIAIDISAQLQATRALQDNEQRLRSMISNLPGAVYRYRNDGNWSVVHISAEIERLTGYPASDFSSQRRSLNSLILPSDLAATRSAQNSLADGEVFEISYRIRHADGHSVWISEKGRGAYADDGELLWLDGFLWDISAEVAAQQERREREDYVHKVLDNVIDGILTFSPQGRIESCNRAAEQIFAYAPAQALGQRASELLAEPYRHNYREHVRALLRQTGERTEAELPRELEGLRQNGERFPLELALSRIRHRGEDKLIAVVRDITERKRVERMQSEFVSTVSHELRTPLTSIAGALGLINGGALGEVPTAISAMLAIAEQNSQRLSLLINDLLDMDKLDAGQMRFDLQPQPLRPLLDQALQASQGYADAYRVRWQLLDVPEQVMLLVDAQRFLQIMANLLSNAAKYSPTEGVVEIRCAAQEQQLRIEVRDHGRGIPEAFRERIFNKFAQADSSDSRQQGGTGLGLAISRELVRRMHGQIGFSCAPGDGTRFWFTLPMLEPP